MLETREKRIGDVTYQVTQLPAPSGRRLLVRLYKVLGPAIAAALRGLPESSESLSLGNLQTAAIGDAMLELAQTLTEDELDHVCEIFSQHTLFSREPEKWQPLKVEKDLHWSGNFLNMFKWLAFCLEVNYSDFLSEQGGLRGSDFLTAQKKESGSQRELIGKSTGSPAPPDIQ